MRDAFEQKLPARHQEFLRSLSLTHVEGDYVFVHAGIKPGRPLAEQVAADVLWIRGEFLDSRADHGHCVVHGHTITDDIDVHHNRIGIDTGAYYSGKLTCLVLEGGERSVLQT
jgi:serine/threonine protein phosphatase 1